MVEPFNVVTPARMNVASALKSKRSAKEVKFDISGDYEHHGQASVAKSKLTCFERTY